MYGSPLKYSDRTDQFVFSLPFAPEILSLAANTIGAILIYNLPDSPPETPIIEKPAICDVEPDDFCEQMAEAEAEAGAGYAIMGFMGNEPRLIAHYGPGPWIKKEHKHMCANGRLKVIHYFHSTSSNKNVELNFKKR